MLVSAPFNTVVVTSRGLRHRCYKGTLSIFHRSRDGRSRIRLNRWSCYGARLIVGNRVILTGWSKPSLDSPGTLAFGSRRFTGKRFRRHYRPFRFLRKLNGAYVDYGRPI